MEYEAVLPFPVLALLIWPAGIIRSAFGLLVVGGVIVAVGQFTVLTRTFSEPKGERRRYFLAHEFVLAVSVFAILGLQLATHDG